MHVYIVHGYGASPAAHWFPWLQKTLAARGATATVVALPVPDQPSPDAWQQALEQQVPVLDRNTYFVAHSLGSIALLRYLEGRSSDGPIGGYVLVSGFNGKLAALPQLDGFARPGIDHEKLFTVTKNRTVIAALDDAIVPAAQTRELATALGARFVPVARGGHFLGSDGFVEFPLVLSELERFGQAGR